MKIPIAILATLSAIQTLAHAETLVDINFDDTPPGQAPPFLNFSPPTNLPSNRLVGMYFGALTIVDQIGGMNRAARFSPGGYCQPVVFDNSLSPTDATRFLFEFDFYLSNFQTRGPQYTSSVDQFTVFFDLPEAHRINFQTTGNEGRISVEGGGFSIGTFSFDATHHLSVSLDVTQQTWTALLDNTPLFTDAFYVPSQNPSLESVRINLADDSDLVNEPQAYIDNIRLTAIPEPQFLPLLSTIGLVLLCSKRLRRGTSNPHRHSKPC